jgi:CHRD domain-containing protein
MRKLVLASFIGVALIASAATAAVAHNDNGKGKARLDSYQETPLTLSTPASGSFRIRMASGGLQYKLRYEGFTTPVLFAHIHLGARGLTGGVIAFLCGGGSKPACPQGSGTVEGTIAVADVIGPANQGIAPGEMTEVIKALRRGAVYANVHSQQFPGGEIRGQIGNNGHSGDDNGRHDKH